MNQRTDRVVIVTGASRGIGAATARLAAQRGYSVCVNYRENRDAANRVVDAIENGGRYWVEPGAPAVCSPLSRFAWSSRDYQAKRE